MTKAQEVLAAYLVERGLVNEKFSILEARIILDYFEENDISVVYTPRMSALKSAGFM